MHRAQGVGIDRHADTCLLLRAQGTDRRWTDLQGGLVRIRFELVSHLKHENKEPVPTPGFPLTVALQAGWWAGLTRPKASSSRPRLPRPAKPNGISKLQAPARRHTSTVWGSSRLGGSPTATIGASCAHRNPAGRFGPDGRRAVLESTGAAEGRGVRATCNVYTETPSAPRVAAFVTAVCWTMAWQRSCLDLVHQAAVVRVQEGASRATPTPKQSVHASLRGRALQCGWPCVAVRLV
jgi:hypothetical protein